MLKYIIVLRHKVPVKVTNPDRAPIHKVTLKELREGSRR